MFFNKPINELTYEDVAAFCQKQIPEGKQLDYKYMLPKDNEKFAKTIASFANAMGGTIIIGVNDDKNDKPKPPFTGIAYHEKMRNSIEDIIQFYIDPIVFVDINVCVNRRRDKMFVVVDIPQSNLTPHLVGKSKRAYIRTGQSSRPEIIVHPEKLPWLLNHRRKSERLRHILYEKAESHFENYLKTKNVEPAGKTVCTFSLTALYPEEPLCDYKKLPEIIGDCVTEAPYGILANPQFPIQPVQDGAAVISNQKQLHAMTEFNTYGLLMHKRVISRTQTFNGHEAGTVSIDEIGQYMTLFFITAVKYFSRLPFGGPLAFRFKINNTRALRALCGKQQATVMEDYIRLDKIYNITEISDRLSLILQQILHEAAWSLGVQLSESQTKEMVQAWLSEVY